jgi:hypothetical protein
MSYEELYEMIKFVEWATPGLARSGSKSKLEAGAK